MAKSTSTPIILILLVAGVCFGQNSPVPTSAEVTGSVSDATGAAIGRASVTFDNGSRRMTVETNSSGSFRVTLPLGNYTATIFQVGFKTAKFTDFRVQSATPAPLNVILQVGYASMGYAYIDLDPPQVPTTNSELPWIIQEPTSQPVRDQTKASAKTVRPPRSKN
jgi:hypothetical protein